MKERVKRINYEQFIAIRNSGQKYKIFDVLPPDSYQIRRYIISPKESYQKGHIEGAISFPLETISKKTVKRFLSRDDKVIVYCRSSQCADSTEAAKKLSSLGYEVFDYKGGLKEWQEKGNNLV